MRLLILFNLPSYCFSPKSWCSQRLHFGWAHHLRWFHCVLYVSTLFNGCMQG